MGGFLLFGFHAQSLKSGRSKFGRRWLKAERWIRDRLARSADGLLPTNGDR